MENPQRGRFVQSRYLQSKSTNDTNVTKVSQSKPPLKPQTSASKLTSRTTDLKLRRPEANKENTERQLGSRAQTPAAHVITESERLILEARLAQARFIRIELQTKHFADEERAKDAMTERFKLLTKNTKEAYDLQVLKAKIANAEMEIQEMDYKVLREFIKSELLSNIQSDLIKFQRMAKQLDVDVADSQDILRLKDTQVPNSDGLLQSIKRLIIRAQIYVDLSPSDADLLLMETKANTIASISKSNYSQMQAQIAEVQTRLQELIYYLQNSGRAAPTKFLIWVNNYFKNLPPWKIVIASFLASYVSKNWTLLIGLNGPERFARMYTRNFFRATYINTALDAGFYTCMNIKSKFLRDILSVLFGVGYLLFPEAAAAKVQQYPTTVQVMRTSWEKPTNPYLRALSYFDRGYLETRKDIQIPRPKIPSPSSFDKDLASNPIDGRLYYPGPISEMAKSNRLIFNVHGGGFVAMTPKHHDDTLSNWSRNLKIPVVSINYKKAPEYPFPWAIEECFDAYRSIVETNGACIGMEGWQGVDSNGKKYRRDPLKIVFSGDSAGATIATSVMVRILEYSKPIRLPTALMLLYPCLNFDLAAWMPRHYMELLGAEPTASFDEFIRNKTEVDLNDPLHVAESPKSFNVLTDEVSMFTRKTRSTGEKLKVHSGYSLTSRMSYFTDRILNPEFMRAMGLMYLGESPLAPDIMTDYVLSPIHTPETLLAQFPKTFIMCGEKDPLIDDSVVFAARLRLAKTHAREEWQKLRRKNSNQDHLTIGKSGKDPEAELESHLFSKDPADMVRVKILPGLSHGFMQMSAFLPETAQCIQLTTEWYKEMFAEEINEDSLELTSLMINEMNEVDENAVLLRRRASMASRIGMVTK